MSDDFDPKIPQVHNVHNIDYNTPFGDANHSTHLHPAHHVLVEEPAPKLVLGKVEQSFMIGVFIICVILVLITLWYVNFSPITY